MAVCIIAHPTNDPEQAVSTPAGPRARTRAGHSAIRMAGYPHASEPGWQWHGGSLACKWTMVAVAPSSLACKWTMVTAALPPARMPKGRLRSGTNACARMHDRHATGTGRHLHASDRPSQWHGGLLTCECAALIPSRRPNLHGPHSIRKTRMQCCREVTGSAYPSRPPPQISREHP